jgi:hypothetical protein
MNRIRRLLSTLPRSPAGLLLVLSAGCQTTEFYQQQKLQDPCMQFDADHGFVTMRNKSEAAREGSFGGFGAAAAGGCACQ